MGNSLQNDIRVSFLRYSIVGVNDDEGPPVPIPNTVVKLIGVDNTRREAAREDRSMPTQRKDSHLCGCFFFAFFLSDFTVCLNLYKEGRNMPIYYRPTKEFP